MRIVVLLKEVVDTYGERHLSLETGLAQRLESEPVLDEIGTRALEVALSRVDQHPADEVVVLSMAPQSAAATLRKGLALGAGSAVQIVDERLRGADTGITALALAAALTRIGFDLVIAGNMSTDGSGGVIPAMLAELLDVPALTSLSSVSLSDSVVSGSRTTEYGSATVSSSLPAVISITEALPDARFPNFKGITAAKKKPFEVFSLDDLGLGAEWAQAPRSIMIAVSATPPRGPGRVIADEGDAGQKIADFLVQNQLA